MSQCKWDVAWVGRCKNDATSDGMCDEHKHKLCASCGAPAVHDCEHTGIQFVCGAPLCGTCEHGIVMPGEDSGMFMLGGGHVTADVHEQQMRRLYPAYATPPQPAPVDGEGGGR